MNLLKFHGDIVNGDLDMDKAELVSVPAKRHYNAVDLGFRNNMIIKIAEIECDWLDYDNKVKLGEEIEKRWNAYPKLNSLITEQSLTLRQHSCPATNPTPPLNTRVLVQLKNGEFLTAKLVTDEKQNHEEHRWEACPANPAYSDLHVLKWFELPGTLSTAS